MTVISAPHDHYFKSAMSDLRVARDFFKHHLPKKILNTIDLESLRRCNESFIDEDLSLLISDLLFTANFLDGIGYIYILLEHKSWDEKMLPFYLLRSQCRIMNYHIKDLKQQHLPIIVPLLFYNGEAKYTSSTDLFDLFEHPDLARDFMFKPIHLIDLSQIPDDELKSHQWACILEFVMKHVRSREIEQVIERLLPSMNTMINFGGSSYIITTLHYLITVADVDTKSLMRKIRDNVSNKIGDAVMTGAERLRQEGRQEGIQEGRQELAREAAKKMLDEGVDIQLISRVLKLSEGEIQKLQELETRSI